MGVANSLFFSSNIQEETLHRRITPTDEQFELQQDRWNALADHLRADPALFVWYENFADQLAVDAHVASTHVARLVMTAGLIIPKMVFDGIWAHLLRQAGKRATPD